MKNEYSKGIILIVISTILWGIAGNIGAYLFKNKGVVPEHLTMLRVLLSGIILLIYQYIRNKEEMLNIFENKKEVLRLLYFGIFGLLAMQYGFFAAVKHSDASTATILQSLSPFIIVIFLAIKRKTWPPRAVSRALFLGLIGAFILVTHGNINQIAITYSALFFGLLAAFGSVNYNLASQTLQKKYDIMLIMAWAMFIAGAFFYIVSRSWRYSFIVDIYSILGILYVVILGTLVPFVLYLVGSKIVGPQRASILMLIEPIAATFISVIFMGAKLVVLDYIGIGMVLAASVLLTIGGRNNKDTKKTNRKLIQDH